MDQLTKNRLEGNVPVYGSNGIVGHNKKILKDWNNKRAGNPGTSGLILIFL